MGRQSSLSGALYITCVSGRNRLRHLFHDALMHYQSVRPLDHLTYLSSASSAAIRTDPAGLLNNRPRGSADADRKGFSFRSASMQAHRSGHILDGVARRDLEQRMIRLRALDSAELIERFAEARIAVFTHDNHLQVG